MSNQATRPDPSPMTNKTVFLLSLSKQDFWDEQYTGLVDMISVNASIKRATKPAASVTYLTANNPSAIIITDAALTERNPSLDAVSRLIVNYVKAGGMATIGTHFTSFVRPSDMNRWFSRIWSLPWKNGDYHRTTVHPNANACEGRLANRGLPTSYSQKAIFLKNVTANALLYMPVHDSRIESVVFAPAPVDGRQIPVTFAKVEDGWLGYVGDVNSEVEFAAVSVAMCGL